MTDTLRRLPTKDQLAEKIGAVQVGQRIRFMPGGSCPNRWWLVRARDDRFIIATAQTPFAAKGDLMHTIVDLTGWQTYRRNGAGEGIVRSSINAIGGGWDTRTNEAVAGMLTGLQSGEWDLSVRRVINVWDIEVPA
jgi:hypothetical protein